MSGAWTYALANRLWLASGRKSTAAFRRALQHPRATQEGILHSLLARNAETEYGRRWGFSRLRTPREYQDAVPIVTYEDLREEIEQIQRGQAGVLTAEPVLMLEKTGGSTGASKYIPYTAGLKREFGAAVAPWMADLYGRRPEMLGGGAYWSVSPLAAEREVTEGGLPVGFEEDTEYFGPLERLLLARLMLTPRELARVPEMEASRYVTLRFLLQRERLAFISVWNPSFLTLLMQALDLHQDRLLTDLERGTLQPPTPLPPDLHHRLSAQLKPRPRRAALLRAAARAREGLSAAALWPHLRVISCWTDAAAAHFLPEMAARFPGVEVQPKGLLATEGVVSIPLTGHPGAAPALTSHFLEFVEEGRDNPRPLLADEVEAGRVYTVLLSTGGGLYRYTLGDRVEVVGWVENSPLIRFLGRTADVSDLCGEKLHEERVRTVLFGALQELGLEPAFAMLAPELGTPPAYVLFLQQPGLSPDTLDALTALIEVRLCEGHHYAYCRRLGQLGPVRGVRVRGGMDTYLGRCAALGQRAGSVKPSVLDRRPGWCEWFLRDPEAAGTAPGARI